MNTAGRNLTNPGPAFITHRVHDQRMTSLCVSFATTTTVRGASINYLTNHGHPEDQIRNELENDFQFSFTKMLTIFTGCISPRSLDGLIINSRNDPHFMNPQAQLIGNAIDRLVNKTAFEENGWKRIKPLVRLFNQYNVDPNNIELEKITVFHPRVAGNRQTFQNAINQNMLIVAQIICNTMTSVNFTPHFSVEDNSPHAVTLFGFDQARNVFQIKNSYFRQKTIEVNADLQFPVYSDFVRNIPQFRQNVPQMFPNFTDQNFILTDVGYCVRFRDRSKF